MNCSLNKLLALMLLAAPFSFPYSQALAADSPELPSVSQTPLFLSGGAPAMVMLVMGRDHTLFTEAYNELTDLNNNKKLDQKETRFDPSYEYYGYFDSYKCYTYASDLFTPNNFITDNLEDTDCKGNWSGNFLNYVTTSRIDALRKALYGGYRVDDPATGGATLEASYVPADAHAWAKGYDPKDPLQNAGFKISKFTKYKDTQKLFFARINDSESGMPKIRVLDVDMLKSKHSLSDADYNALRPWHWAGSAKPVARTAIVKPTSDNGALLQLKENLTDCSGNNCKPSSDLPSMSDNPLSTFSVRVKVCSDASLLSSDTRNKEQCSTKKYTGGGYKPVGLLHEYGESNRAEFGLITGSYQKNLDGGALRRNIADFSKELNADGTFNYKNADGSGVKGIVYNLDKLRISEFNMSFKIDKDPAKSYWAYYGGLEYDKNKSCYMKFSPLSINGECQDWGNPIGEILAEAMRYYHNETGPTTAFTYTADGTAPALTAETWIQPMADTNKVKQLTRSGKARPYCAKPFNLVISNEQVSYDGDNVTGPSSLNWKDEADTIGKKEGLEGKSFFMGDNGVQTTEIGLPTAKELKTLSTVRGMPTEPTKKGSYSIAGVAFWGNKNKIPFPQDVKDTTQKDKTNVVKTMTVGLAPPLPAIKINGGKITLMPIAKSVKKWASNDWTSVKNPSDWWKWSGGTSDIDPSETATQPTSEIVDVAFDSISDNEGTFKVSFADVEQGADYEMDMQASYYYKLDGKTLTVSVTSEFAEGDIEQHAGYVISGVGEKDGLYLEVRDVPDCSMKATKVGAEGSVLYYKDTGNVVDNGITKYLPPYRSAWFDWTSNDVCKQANALQPETANKKTVTRTFTVPDDAVAAQVMKSPLWYAGKWGDFSYDATKSPFPPNLGSDDTPSGYFQVTNLGRISIELSEALNSLDEKKYSASAMSTSSYILSDDSLLFSSSFSPNGWLGDLTASSLKADGSLSNSDEYKWSAAILLSKAATSSRKIYTKGSEFKKETLPKSQIIQLAQKAGGNNLTSDDQEAYGKNLVDYIRGVKSYEATEEPTTGFKLRDRGSISVNVQGTLQSGKAVLGDIVNSTPTFAKDTKNKPFVIVGANDGMAHVFDATNGKELYAYVPSPLLDGSGSNLGAYTQVGYSHQSYVDGNIAVANITEDSKSMTLAVGSMGFGARALYALDLSDVTSLGESTAKWEFTHDAMGYNRASPAIVKMNLGGTLSNVVIASSGYNASAQNGKNPEGTLFILNAKDGTAYHTLSTGVKSGLSEPAIVDKDGDGKADLAYAGDLLGNLWKFDLQDSDKTKWSASKLYSSGQPITSRPTAGPGPDGGVMVYFGTGKYLETNDPETTTTQSVYGIWDKPGSSTTVEQKQLEKRVVSSDAFSRSLKTTDTFTWGDKNKMGWYFDLPESGERVIANPEYVNGKLNVITMIPTVSDPQCDGGGKGWIMQLDALYGRAYYQKTPDEIASSNVKLDGINSNFNQYIALTKDGLTAKEDTQGQTRTRTTITDPSLPTGVGSWKQLY